MKKLIMVMGVMALVLALGYVGIAQADPVYFKDPPPTIQTWTSNPSTGIPTATLSGGDFLGPEFQSYGAKLNYAANKLYLYSLFGPAQTAVLNFTPANTIVAADLYLTDVSNNSYLVRLTTVGGATQGEIYNANNAANYKTSEQIMSGQTAGTNYQFGGRYSNSNPYDGSNLLPVPVWATGGDTGNKLTVFTSQGVVTEGPFNLGALTWTYEIDLGTLIDADAGFFYLWGTGTCGNDVIGSQVAPSGRVPVPGALLLFGTGLVGLAALRGRRVI